MDRRRFLAAAALAPPALLAAPAAKAATPAAVISSSVTAIAETNGDRPLPVAGAPLRLSLDRGRGYDPRSVLVSTPEGERLGYLPPMHGQTIEPLLLAGFAADAWVKGCRTGRRQKLDIVIAIRAGRPCDRTRPAAAWRYGRSLLLSGRST